MHLAPAGRHVYSIRIAPSPKAPAGRHVPFVSIADCTEDCPAFIGRISIEDRALKLVPMPFPRQVGTGPDSSGFSERNEPPDELAEACPTRKLFMHTPQINRHFCPW